MSAEDWWEGMSAEDWWEGVSAELVLLTHLQGMASAGTSLYAA